MYYYFLVMNKNKSPEWWDNDGGFFGRQYLIGDNSIEGYIPCKHETLEKRTQREVGGIIRLLNLHRGESILDVPCGYGRHTIQLWWMGFDVAGVDINIELLVKACETAEIHKMIYDQSQYNILGLPVPGKILEFGLRDMRHLSLPPDANYQKRVGDQYDAVINMFYSFGFFSNDEVNRSVMVGFYNQLKDGGKLLLHTDVSPEMILDGGHYRLSERRNLRDGGQLHIEESYDPKSKRISGSWTICDSDGHATQLTPYSVRIYSAQEFKEMAMSCGFSKVDIYGTFNGDPFTPNSCEMIVVAKKCGDPHN